MGHGEDMAKDRAAVLGHKPHEPRFTWNKQVLHPSGLFWSFCNEGRTQTSLQQISLLTDPQVTEALR